MGMFQKHEWLCMSECGVSAIFSSYRSSLGDLFFRNACWCLNRHLCILPERFAKKDLNLVIVCRKDVT